MDTVALFHGIDVPFWNVYLRLEVDICSPKAEFNKRANIK